MPEPQRSGEPRQVKEVFSDLNTQTPWLGLRVLNVAAVVRAIMSALTQPPYQRLFDPSGFNLESYLFRLSETAVEVEIQNYLDYIAKDDPRYYPDRANTRIESIDKDNHVLLVQVAFRLSTEKDMIYRFTARVRY